MKKFLLVLFSLLVIMSCSLDSKSEEDSKKKEIAGSQEPGSQEPGSQEPGSQEPGSQEPGSQEPGSQEPGSPISLSRGLLKDSEGNLIGYILNAYSTDLHIITEKGYMVNLDWKGELWSYDMYFTEANGTGISFRRAYEELTYGKCVYPSDGKIYVPKNVENEIVKLEDLNLIAKSKFDGYDKKMEELSPHKEINYCMILKEVTKADIGFPETISLPLVIDFK